MKNSIRLILSLAVALGALSSCNSGKWKMLTPQSSGRPYEVLVIIDGDTWESLAGRALFDVLDTDIPGLPQPERSFHISQASPKDYNRTLRMFRNIIEVDIDRTQYTTTKMKFARNEYANEQVILRINSPSGEAFATYVTEHAQDIIDFFNNTEINRLCVSLRDDYSHPVHDMVREMFGCEFHVPKELKSYKRGKDFLWVSNNSATGLVSICVYSYPYEGPWIFNKRYILHKRDSVMQANIPGEEPDMYMQTDTLYTDVKPIVVHHAYAMEARGLWYMRNDAMGGPFVSQSRVDTRNNRVITAEGFVYAPEKMKRGLMHRMEGALYTLLLPEEQGAEPDTETEDNITNE